MNRFHFGALPRFCLIALNGLCHQAAEADEPIATIAVVSNPYITTLPANQILDERGTDRGNISGKCIASTAVDPSSLESGARDYAAGTR